MTTITTEEYDLMKDSKYRVYVAAIDKALKNFEYTSEWADLISALGKLNKVLLSYAKFPLIPRRIKIGKRLAQCMHPSLPSGVHLKALETYDIIFRCLGTAKLSFELFIYSAGLFPLMSHAAMSIRPALLAIYETHFVPLKEKLKPALNGFLNGTLPSLEAGSDHFERTNFLLEKICVGVGHQYFFTCIWQCVKNNYLLRFSAVSYVSSHYNRKLSMDDQLYLLGYDLDLMVSSLCAAVEDTSILVQRAALDLLLTCFPMNNKQLLYPDMVRLVTSSLATILRRDMSLNRRLYAWLLEADNIVTETGDNIVLSGYSFTHTVAYDLLNDALRILLRKSAYEITINVKAYKILTSLFDKPQIGSAILDSILFDVFRALYFSCLRQHKHKTDHTWCISLSGNLDSLKNQTVLNEEFLLTHCQELIKNANLLFNTLQTHYIWSYVEKMYEEAILNLQHNKNRSLQQVNDVGEGAPTILEICILTDFLLNIVPCEFHDDDTSTILPTLFKSIVNHLKKSIKVLHKIEIVESLKLCEKIMKRIQNLSLVHRSTSTSSSALAQPAPRRSSGLPVKCSNYQLINVPKISLEKSKSDSKIHEAFDGSYLTSDNSIRDRSYSNQMCDKNGNSDNKGYVHLKSMRSKSSSKLYEYSEKDIHSNDKYTLCDTKPSHVNRKTSADSINCNNKHLESCLHEYQKFYVSFIENSILPSVNTEVWFANMLINREQKCSYLKKLLENSLDGENKFHDTTTNPLLEHDTLNDARIEKFHSSEDEPLMLLASTIFLSLLRLANFPIIEEQRDIPQWLAALITTACHQSLKMEVQIIGINTLLDIFDIAKFKKNDFFSIGYIEESTIVIEELANILWGILKETNKHEDVVTCVALLYKLHSIFHENRCVEDILAAYLVPGAVTWQNMKLFINIWHLGRDVTIKSLLPKENIKNFDRCLFKILDNLWSDENPSFKTISEKFLVHCLSNNDIRRVFCPILIRLLAPKTSRMSIKFIDLTNTNKQATSKTQGRGSYQENEHTKKVCTISSIDGNIMYHISGRGNQKPCNKKRWFGSNSDKNLPFVDMRYFLNGQYKNVEGHTDTVNSYVLADIEVCSEGNVELFVNPLSSKDVFSSSIHGSYKKRGSVSSLEENIVDNNLLKDQHIKDNHLPNIACDNGKGHEVPRSKSLDQAYQGPVDSDIEISTNEYVGFIDDILKTVLKRVYSIVENQKDNTSSKISKIIDTDTSKMFSHYHNSAPQPIHNHICLYYDAFDSHQILYLLRTLEHCILCCPHIFIKYSATTSVGQDDCSDILYLLERHRRAIGGGGFPIDYNSEIISPFKGYTFLDITITICLNYLRTFHSFWNDSQLSDDDISNNLEIHIVCMEILEIIMKHLIKTVNDNKNIADYISDMLRKCELQSIILNCLYTSVSSNEDVTFAEQVLLYNHFTLYDENHKVTKQMEIFQVKILRVIEYIIILEHHIYSSLKKRYIHEKHGNVSFPVVQQKLFGLSIIQALLQKEMWSLHENWLNMVVSSLPYFGSSLNEVCSLVIYYVCSNIELTASSYMLVELGRDISIDYAMINLDSLTIICQYCLLDAKQASNEFTSTYKDSSLSNTSELMNNILGAFFPSSNPDMNMAGQNNEYYRLTRESILSRMPRILSCVAKLWRTIVSIEKENYNTVFGNSKRIKQRIMELLCPIYTHYAPNYLAALGMTWHDRRNQLLTFKTVLPEANSAQSSLVHLISEMKGITLEDLVHNVTSVIKSPPNIEEIPADTLEVCILEFLYCYLRNTSVTHFSEAWTSLMLLLKECNCVTPRAQFVLAALLHELILKCCPVEDKRDQKDLQDITIKIVECISQICGSSLEQTTWLRRNFAVRNNEDFSGEASSLRYGIELSAANSISVQAQLVLAEILAPILDVCFGSTEKEKVITILTSVMGNVVPYLKTHTMKNLPNFQACSKLLASLTSYQYTRKSWKKEVCDLLYDNMLFQMDCPSLRHWKVVIDNLMAHDNTIFRDLMTRISITQSGSLSIFTSKEQEYEQKSQLLKRLAFVIFCSERDQYAKYMPEMQEHLTSNLRFGVPSIQNQVFTCFRVILIRMSPFHLTCLWPTIITELLQVFIQIEQELCINTMELSVPHAKLASLESNHSQNIGIHALGNTGWLRLQLSAVKLLDLALLLPPTFLPQFQMYRWAFVRDNIESTPQHDAAFVPHVVKIAELMDLKFEDAQVQPLAVKHNELLLTLNEISHLKDLHSFFKTLSISSHRYRTECSKLSSTDRAFCKSEDEKLSFILEKVDKVIENDFLDPIIR